MAHGLHVRAQLVGAAGVRAQGHPGHARPGAADGDELGLGGLGLGILGIDRHDHLAVVDALLGQGHVDDALGRVRRADDQRPVGLLRLVAGEGARQAGGGGGRLAQHQHAGGVAVEPVDQAGALQPLPPGRQQAVDVLAGLGAALDGEAGRLVEHQHLLVLVDHQRAGELGVAVGQDEAFARLRRVGQRRDTDLRAGLQPGVGLGARAVDADLAGAGHALDLDLGQVRPAATEPAVQAHAVFAGLTGIDEQGFDFTVGHAAVSFRASIRPANRAATDSTTDRVA